MYVSELCFEADQAVNIQAGGKYSWQMLDQAHIIAQTDVEMVLVEVEQTLGVDKANLLRAEFKKLLAKIRIYELERDGDE